MIFLFPQVGYVFSFPGGYLPGKVEIAPPKAVTFLGNSARCFHEKDWLKGPLGSMICLKTNSIEEDFKHVYSIYIVHIQMCIFYVFACFVCIQVVKVFDAKECNKHIDV